MRRAALILILIATVGGGAYWYSQSDAPPAPINKEAGREEEEQVGETAAVTTIVRNLEIPWDIAFLPEGGMLVTERTGHVIAIALDGTQKELPVPGVKKTGEGGLLGIVLHPDFKSNHLLYLYMSAPGTSDQTQNRVVRYRYENGILTEDRVIIDHIPGATYHDGGRMEFGPDGMLYITTGDATTPKIAQDKNSLGGKILRLKDDGVVPTDNPFGTDSTGSTTLTTGSSPQAAVWSYGHRNPQGLAWDSAGRLWETEHGPTGEGGRCCNDEINFIQKGATYGWPTIIGGEYKAGMITPAWGSEEDTWAPASIAYLDGKLYFGGLKGEALYEAVLDGERIVEFKEHFKGEFGRIRTVRVGPDGMLYLTTSNRDNRGSPTADDDRILRINPEKLR